eukprot:SM000172S03070  [mRNA]  locus=s172:158704:163832:- [translate_table: standard]
MLLAASAAAPAAFAVAPAARLRCAPSLRSPRRVVCPLRRIAAPAASMAAPATDSMKGWYYEHKGDPLEVLKFGDLPAPSPGPKQVLVAVKAAGLNPVDKMVITGFLAGDAPFPRTPGWELAGVVKAVGDGVTKFKPGDEVYGWDGMITNGSLAELALISEAALAPKPSNMSFVEAVAVPVGTMTALQVFRAADLKEGQKVFISAGAGGVGSIAIQLAKVVFKAGEVATSASAPKHDLLKSLGADRVIDYKTEKVEEVLSDYDLVFDAVGEASKGLKIIKEGGKVFTIIDFGAPEPVQKIQASLKGEELEKMTPYFEKGELKVILDPTGPYPLEKASDGIAYLLKGRATGKVVIIVPYMAAAAGSMKGWYYERSGDPLEVLQFGDLPAPSPGPKEVLVAVKVAGLNPVDKMIITGYLGGDVPFPKTPGVELAGVVKEVGDGVTKFKPGDEVYGWDWLFAHGSLAELAVIPEASLALKPADLSFVESVAVPVGTLTSLQVFRAADLKEGQKVFISAGAGGVGSIAIQLAKVVFKAGEVASSASTPKHDLLKSLGADRVIDYKTEKVEEVLSDYDLVYDCVGEATKALKIIKEGGKVFTIVNAGDPEPVQMVRVTLKGEELEQMTPYFEKGELKVVLDPTGPYALEKASEGLAYLFKGRATGKVVITVP